MKKCFVNMTDQELRELQRKHIKEAEENGELMFLGIPDSWFEDPHWMCRNEHVSRRYLKTEYDAVCLECYCTVRLMPPEKYPYK